ncbi:hypothetical protein OIU74_022381 [Salix koriyanagi]|uniref:Uncharacterized protein n=1 Tax=Salix koriyanagi TaxID=2511006 RepID=A0A9Q0WML4_9ROSI|nr:hypothetical protein OIU74_022381 [Salix koriyanagi]
MLTSAQLYQLPNRSS